ncbi:hypothetical protein SAMN04487981_101522 [Streptomyces sp. cf386]|uniref:hypothetical protein n=1 Tax=Streptomyces sp. cf386 TaxID=1761904 RepID=UPI0008919FD4|nr:hypothetical protein [Streptomyces sp. cf386]SDM43987.1 hypothetical protein SAMN04487981_101522 [Streptomyces sp. cf386]
MDNTTALIDRPTHAQRAGLHAALTALAPLDRAVVRELYLLRRPPAQAAEELGMPLAELHARATRAVRRLGVPARARRAERRPIPPKAA